MSLGSRRLLRLLLAVWGLSGGAPLWAELPPAIVTPFGLPPTALPSYTPVTPEPPEFTPPPLTPAPPPSAAPAKTAAKTAPESHPEDIYFHFDRYTRDLHANTLIGHGHSYLKIGIQEVWADDVEIDYNTRRAIANGNVHIKEGTLEIWCTHANYALSGENAILDDATLSAGQFVITGVVIRKLGKGKYVAENGSYSNCNLDVLRDPDLGKCDLEWKIFGKKLSVTVEEYVHIEDALIYAKRMPVLYFPYFVAPAKTQRSSGILVPVMGYNQILGNGIEIPYFLALSPWQDLTIDPTEWTAEGYHVGLDYRYIYSPTKQGYLNFNFTRWRFKSDPDSLPDNPRPEDTDRKRTLGIIGEWAVMAQDVYSVGERSQVRMDLRLVSNPYYTQYFAGDLDGQTSMPALRSQLSFSSPGDDKLFTARVERHESLVISVDTGSDQGPVTELPTVTFSQKNSPLLGQLFSWEFDSRFDDFYRPSGFDNVPVLPSFYATAPNQIPAPGLLPDASSPGYQTGDWIRTGRRLNLEPRLVMNVPMPSGFQFQPELTTGTYLYNFDLPNEQVLHQDYVQFDIPFSLYLSRTFDTGISGFEKVNHVFQPRFEFAMSPYQSSDPAHPFFTYQAPLTGIAPTGFSLYPPRFDINDYLAPYEYARVELINRFRRKTEKGIDRFFLLQVAEQYNFKSQDDPAYQFNQAFLQNSVYEHAAGPLEILADFSVGHFSLKGQAEYQVETTSYNGGLPTHEYNISSSLTYQVGPDFFSLSGLLQNLANQGLGDQTVSLSFKKKTPTFFDFGGSIGYSFLHKQLLGYSVGFYVSEKPRSCWDISLVVGQDVNKIPFASFSFALKFGDALGMRTL